MAQSQVTVYDELMEPQLTAVADTSMRGIAITYVRGDWFDKIKAQQIADAMNTLGNWLRDEQVIGWE